MAIAGLSRIAGRSIELAEEVVALPWFSDGVTEDEGAFTDVIASKSARDLELIERLIQLPWIVDDITEVEVVVVNTVASLEFEDVEAANWAVNLEWLADGASPNERTALWRVLRLRLVDVELSDRLAGADWLSDGVTVAENGVLDRLVQFAQSDLELAREVATYRWIADGLTSDHVAGDERGALRFLNQLSGMDKDLARRIAGLPWLSDSVMQSEVAVIHALTNIAKRDVDLAARLVSLPWLSDRATGLEWSIATALDQVSERDVALANYMASLEWFVDEVSDKEGDALGNLIDVALRDVELAGRVAGLTWFRDGVTWQEAATVVELSSVASNDPGFARELAGFGWFTQGVTDSEGEVRLALTYMATIDTELLSEVAALPWLFDGVTEVEGSALLTIASLSWKDLELGSEVVSVAWLRDGVTQDEKRALDRLNQIASNNVNLAKEITKSAWFSVGTSEVDGAVRIALVEIMARDVEFAKEIAALPWLMDGATKLEASGIYSLDNIASKDEGLVRQVLSWPRYQDGVIRDLDFFLLWALGRADEELLDTLKARTWFTDGVTDEEAALIVTMAGQVPSLYKELLIDSHLYHETISLPLAGDINVWLVQDTSPVLNQESLRQVESAAEIAEEFFGVPFPTTDLIVLLVTEGKREYGHLVRHLGSHMSVIVHRGRLYGIPHEAAHYYLTSNFLGHPWFTEGGATFVEAHVNHERGWQEISSRETVVSKDVQSYCVDSGVENIRHNAYLLDRRHISLFQCTYRLGEYLMLRLLNIMGKNAMSSALNELYVSSGGHLPALRFSTPPTEEEIYGVFLKHAPSQQGRIQKLFQILHGGDFAFSEIDTGDEEADEAEDAILVEIGEAATGSLDYIFDFDFFKFEAEEGQIYRISVKHETLTHTSVTMYGPDGDTELRNRWQGRVMGAEGPLIQWRAPSSEAYFLAVQNFGGKTGEYTFTITPVEEPEADDHGNGIESATRVGRFKDIHGTIDGTFDEDYFRFSAHEGRVYHIFMWPEQSADLCAQMYRADGSRSSEWHNRCDHGSLWEGGQVHGISWVAPETGDFYLAMSGFMESVGDYRFEIILALDPGNPS